MRDDKKTTKGAAIGCKRMNVATPITPDDHLTSGRHDDSVDALIARMERTVKEACQTPKGAKDLLIRIGFLTKKGTIRKKFLC